MQKRSMMIVFLRQPNNSTLFSLRQEEEYDYIPYYSTLTENEIYLIELTVENEAGIMSDEFKEMIATVIYNRVISDDFPDTVTEVLYQENQFYNGNYKIWTICNETREAVKRVFERDPADRIHEATCYYDPTCSSPDAYYWFEANDNLEFLFEYEEPYQEVVFYSRWFKIVEENDDEV